MLLLIDKPIWITSQDAITAVKKHLYTLPLMGGVESDQSNEPWKRRKIKIWHAGTLDPMASGLLIAATDKDTKLLHGLTGTDKWYETTIDFSIVTDTWDMDYRKEISFHFEKKDHEESGITVEKIRDKLSSLIGTHELPLTPFSAKKVDGRKLYEYAREWNPIFLTIPMTVYAYEIVGYTFPHLTLKLHVGSGTYIRSIGHRLGTQLEVWWTLTYLRRLQVWNYALSQTDAYVHYQATRDEKQISYRSLPSL